jgi:hypothetical protein
MSVKPLLNQKALEQKHHSVRVKSLRRFYEGMMFREEQAFDWWPVHDNLNYFYSFINGIDMFT